MEKFCDMISDITGLNSTFINVSGVIEFHCVKNETANILRDYFPKNTKSELNTISRKNIINYTIFVYLNHILAPIYKNNVFIGVITLGPFLTKKINSTDALTMASELGIPSSMRTYFRNYLDALPIYELNHVNNIMDLLNRLCSSFDDTTNILPIKYINLNPIPIRDDFNPELNKSIYMNLVEKRYEWENEILNAVKTCNYTLAIQIKNKNTMYSDSQFRYKNNELRSIKNSLLAFNTLLRKTVESANIHPFQIDDLSSKFAIIIENQNSMDRQNKITDIMLKEYCELILNNSFSDYDDYFAKILRFIKINLQNNITIDDISKLMLVSPRKITTDFKKYLDKTFITYLNEERIKHAIFLMDNTTDNVISIALNSGFNDPNYFTKVFKKYTGLTPSAYIKQNSINLN